MSHALLLCNGIRMKRKEHVCAEAAAQLSRVRCRDRVFSFDFCPRLLVNVVLIREIAQAKCRKSWKRRCASNHIHMDVYIRVAVIQSLPELQSGLQIHPSHLHVHHIAQQLGQCDHKTDNEQTGSSVSYPTLGLSNHVRRLAMFSSDSVVPQPDNARRG